MQLLRRVWQAWKRIGGWMGDLIARVVLTVMYFTIVMPFGVAVRLLADPLRLDPRDRGWLPREDPEATLERAREQI